MPLPIFNNNTTLSSIIVCITIIDMRHIIIRYNYSH